jgi:hypothetical protein
MYSLSFVQAQPFSVLLPSHGLLGNNHSDVNAVPGNGLSANSLGVAACLRGGSPLESEYG